MSKILITNSKETTELEELLRIINLAPMTTQFRSEDDFFNDYFDKTGIKITENDIENRTNLFQKYLLYFLQDAILRECLPYPELTQFVVPDEDRIANGIITENYFFFLQCRRDIRLLLNEASRFLATKRLEWRKVRTFTDASLGSNFLISASVLDGKFKFELSLFARALQDVDVQRVKMCLLCEKVFLANRLNKKFCEKKCSNLFHQRLSYKKPENREKLLRNKKAIYHSQKDSDEEKFNHQTRRDWNNQDFSKE